MDHLAGLLLDSGITSYIGGGILRKSFSLKHRAKEVGNNNPENSYALTKND